MKIFIDTAKLDEIKEALSWGIVDGVTTNPSLIKQAVDALGGGVDMESYIDQILRAAGKGHDVSLEVIGLTEEEMFEQAKKLHGRFNSIAGNAVIKIPANPSLDEASSRDYDGLKATKRLFEEGIKVNYTLVMTPEQALLGAKAGARYVSPFAGRIDDYLRRKAGINFGKEDYYEAGGLKRESKILSDEGIVSGVDLVNNIVQVFRKYCFETEIIAASVRNPRQVRELALTGVDIATIPFNVLKKMTSHEKTYEGMRKFTADIVPEYASLFKKV